MRIALVLPLLVGAALLAAPVGAVAQAPLDREIKITLACRDVPLREAVQTVVASGHMSFLMSQEAGDAPVTLNLQQVSPQSALRTLVRVAGPRTGPGRLGGQETLTESRFGDLYIIYSRPDEAQVEANPDFVPLPLRAEGPATGVKITASFINHPVGAVIRQLFAGTGIRYTLNPRMPATRVTLHAREIPLSSILQGLSRVVPGTRVRQEGEAYHLSIPGPVLEEPEQPQRPGKEGIVAVDVGEKISITTQDAPLRTVIDNVYAGSGRQYAIDAAVPDVRLTLKLKDVSLDSALRAIVQQAAVQEPRLVM